MKHFTRTATDVILSLSIAMGNLLISWNASRRSPEEQLDAAIMSGDILEVNHLLASPVVQERLPRVIGRLLSSSVYTGDIRIVNRMLEFEATQEYLIEDSLFSNYTLRCAAEIGSLSILNRLLEIPSVRANVTVQNSWVLLEAAVNGHLPVVNRLLEYAAVRDSLQVDGLAILEALFSQGYLAIIDRLLDFKAIRESMSENSNLLLFNAAEAGHLQVVNRLLEIPAVRNKVNIDTLEAADIGRHYTVVESLILRTTVSACEGFKELCTNCTTINDVWRNAANERVGLLQVLAFATDSLPIEIWSEVANYLPSMQTPVPKEGKPKQTTFDLVLNKAEEYKIKRLKFN